MQHDLYAELSALAATSDPMVIEPARLVISDHAVARFRERVEGLPRRCARRRMVRLLADSEWQRYPARWARVVLHDGVRYGFPRSRPDVCFLVRDEIVLTVLSRKFFGRTAA